MGQKSCCTELLHVSSQACHSAISQLWHAYCSVAVFCEKTCMENSSLYLLHVLHVQPAIASASQEHVQTNMIDFYNEKLVHWADFYTENRWQNHYNIKVCIVQKPADLYNWPKTMTMHEKSWEWRGVGAYGNFSSRAVGCIPTQRPKML